MPPKIGELQLTNHAPGQPITGTIFWLHGYETYSSAEGRLPFFLNIC